jgi:hypothetical protein
MSYVVRPISDRTPFTGKQVDSQFTVTWTQAENLLLAELRHLKARDIVLEIDLPETAIRLDGRPRADPRAASPAVRLAFETPGGPLVFATDKFRRASYRWNKGMQPDWQHNVYAIAKGLEALRLVDRYGIVERDQQYTGFKALPAGRAMPASHMTATQAAEVLERVAIGEESGLLRDRELARIQTDKAHAREVWREARKVAHPDRRDGDHTVWNQVEQAAAVLGVAS